jgi:eukaryotic-like serine/threonine-protein kinase
VHNGGPGCFGARWPLRSELGHCCSAIAIEGRILNSLSHGAIVGERYRIVAPLARGGFGAVYVAEQLTTERRVALKVLARHVEHISIARLLAEARVTSRIQSDHIVQVIDAGVDAATSDVFVVMELLRGMTLDQRLEQGALPAPEVADYVRQVAVGLDKVHGHLDRDGRPTPIIHRDLKPSNIFLTSRDDGKTLVKILDFGAAKVLSELTKASGLVRGTPQFMASEQALGEPCTVGTDIWALGLITFNLLTGSSYWLTVKREEGTETQLFAEILTLPLVSASQRARELGVTVQLPPAFDRWFVRCVNRDPAQRFSSAGLAAFELSRLLGVEPAQVSEAQRLPALPSAAADASPRPSNAQQLETHAVVALSRTPRVRHPSRTRASLTTLGLVISALASATAVMLWKRAPITVPSSSSISASPPPPSADITPATNHPSAAVAPSAAPSAAPSVPEQPAARPVTATPNSRVPNSEKRAPSAPPVAPPKPTPVKPDPYQQR